MMMTCYHRNRTRGRNKGTGRYFTGSCIRVATEGDGRTLGIIVSVETNTRTGQIFELNVACHDLLRNEDNTSVRFEAA